MESIADKQTPAPGRSYIRIIISIIIFLITLLIVFVVSIIESAISITAIFFLFTAVFFTGIWICTSKTLKQYRTDIYHIFFFTLIINVIAVVGTAYLFKYNIGILTGANDETRAYIEGDMQGKSKAEQQRNIDRAPYSFYLYLLTAVSLVARDLGGNSPFNFKILSAFFGGCVPVVIFAHFIRKYPLKKVKRIAMVSALFPCFIYYAATGVRDIIIIFLTALFFFILIDKRRTWKRTALLLGIVYCMVFFRLEQAAFLLATHIVYYLIESLKKLNYLKIVFIMVYSALLLLGGIQFQGALKQFIQEQIIEQKEFYTRIFMNSALRKRSMETSLTLKIRNLPIPFNYIIMFGYNVLNNFPPYLLLESQVISSGSVRGSRKTRIEAKPAKWPVSYGRILKALGPLVWYFVLPYVLLGLFGRKYRFDFDERFIIVLCFLYIFGVSIFTTDIGRIVVVYGNMFPFGIMTRYQSPPNLRRKVDIFTLTAIIFILGVYLFLKSGL